MTDPLASAASTAASASSAAAATAQANAFRNADFLKIMLSEITTQDPMQPQDTSKMVEEMQQLQQLSNTQYQAFRDDLKWGQQLIGQTVNVQQQAIDGTAKQTEINAGLNPDVGYGTVTGMVTSFRQSGQSVYVTVNGHDYPIANVGQVLPPKNDPTQLADIAGHLLGTKVSFHRADASDTGSGTVTNLGYDTDGKVVLTVAGEQVPYANVTQIGLPNS
jgi:hypothetical protein